ncbi:hypothetical protein [Rheinheimera sp. NSM]|uniref:hypothetical protein n=1 Tax=Rheinheimera sp. NSM TaxID=3457884 RepID=UPI004036818B
MTKEESDKSDLISKINEDNNVVSNRKLIAIFSFILLAISLSGAVIKEANTFIFKIEFSNPLNLTHLLAFFLIVITLRYYTYASKFHKELRDAWVDDLFENGGFFYYDVEEQEFRGRMSWHMYQESANDIEKSKYTYSCKFFFVRYIYYSPQQYPNSRFKIELTKFTDKWRLKDYLYLLLCELKYQMKHTLLRSEGVELFSPYFLSIIALFLHLWNY